MDDEPLVTVIVPAGQAVLVNVGKTNTVGVEVVSPFEVRIWPLPVPPQPPVPPMPPTA